MFFRSTSISSKLFLHFIICLLLKVLRKDAYKCDLIEIDDPNCQCIHSIEITTEINNELTIKCDGLSQNESSKTQIPNLIIQSHLTSISLIFEITNKNYSNWSNSLANAFFITSLSLISNQIYEIHQIAFANLFNLVELNLQRNNLKSILNGVFNHLKNLESLDLSYNHINSIDMDSFSKCLNLKSIDISQNQLKSFNLGVVSGLKKLTKLDVSFNLIEVLVKAFFSDGLVLSNIVN